MSAENIARKARITNKTFRMSKNTKRMLALHSFRDADQRADFRRSMIEAQVASSVVVKREKKEFSAATAS